MYAYKQVKKLLKSPTKKVSVEILVKKSHFDDDGIQVIDEFVLTGITILGDKIREGIPGAHLNILDLMKQKDFTAQVKCLSFAYKEKDGNEININLDLGNESDLYIQKNAEVRKMTYQEKRDFLNSKLVEAAGDDKYICLDFSDDFVICYSCEENKYYKVMYAIEENEDATAINFDFENKTEQIPSYKDMPKQFVQVGDEEKTIDELFSMYTEAVENLNGLNEKYATLEGEFEDYKKENETKVYSIVIDDVEYNVDTLNAKYTEDIAQKNSEIEELNQKYSDISTECDGLKTECDNLKTECDGLKTQIENDKKDALCGQLCDMIDDEDDLDEEEKDDLKAKCKAYEFASMEDGVSAIALAVYQKKQATKTRNFKSNAQKAIQNNANDVDKNIFDAL